MGNYRAISRWDKMLGELMEIEDTKWRKIPFKIELNLDEAIRKLKEMKSQIPQPPMGLSSRENCILEELLAIIEGLEVPLKMNYEEAA